MRGKIRLIIISLILSAFLCSCSLFPPPNDTITPPQRNKDVSASNKDITSVVNVFLPQGAVLIEPPMKGVKAIQESDLDKDGKNEILVTYKSDIKQIKSGFMILKVKDDKWEKAYENSNTFLAFEDVRIVDERTFPKVVFIRTTDGKTSREFSYVFCYGDKFNEFKQVQDFSELEIKDLDGIFGQDGRDEWVFKIDGNSNSLDYYILRTGSITFNTPSDLEFPEYQMKVVEFYQNKIKSEPDNIEYYTKLAQTQSRIEMYKEALGTIEKGLKLKLSEKDNLHLIANKCGILNNFGRFDETQRIVSNLKLSGSGELLPLEESIQDSLARSYIGQRKYDKARDIFSKLSNFPYPETIQELDLKIAGEKIFNHLNKTYGRDLISPDKFEDFRKWGDTQGIEVIPLIPEGLQGSKILIVQYYIVPEKAHGKTDVGAMDIYWAANGKLYSQSFGDIKYVTPVSAKFSIDNKNIPTMECEFKYNPGSREVFYPSINAHTDKIKALYKLKDNNWIVIE